ncbi:DUF1971 domain-containing protein [Candidatus Cetobacterium colombiensis]|uniref:DUF1971 domain-containing protein n=1 Tax=Candidatus Cetobacterium colombiensis TaxID=3073100 RepID=A0ABU4WG06_9FUSO|nr:DUF1971 domain-containing protein [Candidatus Cetobacterium colombiensis]MDX8337300.1 DUF1971 domain-containing protein [Candidatus Cetobacterium colombiensis]
MKKFGCACDEEKEPTILDPSIDGPSEEIIEEHIREKIEEGLFDDNPIYDKNHLSDNLKKLNETPVMNEKTIFPDILKAHKLPEGKFGLLRVLSGKVNFVWEENPEVIYTVDSDHPLVIFPEKHHRVILNGPAELKVEFYE